MSINTQTLVIIIIGILILWFFLGNRRYEKYSDSKCCACYTPGASCSYIKAYSAKDCQNKCTDEEFPEWYWGKDCTYECNNKYSNCACYNPPVGSQEGSFTSNISGVSSAKDCSNACNSEEFAGYVWAPNAAQQACMDSTPQNKWSSRCSI